MRVHIIEAVSRELARPNLVLDQNGQWGHFVLTDAAAFTRAEAKRKAEALRDSLPGYIIAAAPERKPSPRPFE
jgi:hypothetical protein